MFLLRSLGLPAVRHGSTFQGWQRLVVRPRVLTPHRDRQRCKRSPRRIRRCTWSHRRLLPRRRVRSCFSLPPPDNFYPANTQLQASVSQNPGFQFHTWQGDLAGSQSLTSLNVSGPKAIGAVFSPVPYLPPAAVQNSAGLTPANGVAPGAVVSIYGLNLAGATLAGPASPLVQTLLNVTATLGQQILPIYFVSPQQINVQLPYETPLGNQLLVVHQTGQPDVNAVFSVVRNAPGLFAITHPDGTPVNAANPATVGEILTISGTGFGPYDQNPPDGIAVPNGANYNLLDPVIATAGGVSVSALSSGPTVGSVGMNFATFQVPSSLPSGTSVPLIVTINGVDSNQLSLFLQ